MNRVKVILIGAQCPPVPMGGGEKIIPSEKVRVEDAETGEVLDCRDITINMPLEGVISASVEMIVSEITVE